MEIYILSSGRAQKQTTWDNLPRSLQERVKLVVPPDEATAYGRYPLLTGGWVVRNPGKVRQALIQRAKNKIVMLDDDLVFATRRTDDPTRFREATPYDLSALFNEIEDSLREFAHVGVAPREGGNRNTFRTMQCTRMMRVLAYSATTLRKHKVRFDRLHVMEDFDVTLQLLRLGYPNLILNHMVQNQNGSNAAGGCSQWRTPQIQTDAAYALKELHPRYVTVVQKETKTAWGGGVRTDVRIQWKEAYASSR